MFNSIFKSKNNFKGKKKFYEIEKKEKKQVNEVKQAEKKDVTCYNCQKKGHIAKDCQSPKKKSNNFRKRNPINRQVNRL